MQSNKQLKLGIMTNKELAEWFGITNTSLSHNKENKLKQLKQFAKYQLRGDKIKKVYIIEIYNPIYKPMPKSRQIVENQFFKVWNFDGIDTCKRVAGEIYRGNKQKLNIKQDTTYQYVLDVRNKGWGSIIKEKQNMKGLYGECRLVWGKLVGKDHIECFTQEEQIIKEQLMKKYFGNATEKQIIVKGMVDSGEISKEQAWDVLQELTLMDWKMPAFIAELSIKIGYPIVKGTELISAPWGQKEIEQRRKELIG